MGWFYLILLLIAPAEGNYGFVCYSEKATAEKKGVCSFSVVSTQNWSQDPQAARAQEGVWDSPKASLERRTLPRPYCRRDGAVCSRLEVFGLLEDEQSLYSEVCPLWDQVDARERPYVRSTERASQEPKTELSVLELHRMECRTLERCYLG